MSSIQYVKHVYEYKLPFVTFSNLRDLFQVKSRRTLDDIVKRFIKEGILIRLEKGKYMIFNKQANQFEIAQFLYSPSYISFETALNWHSILLQFPMVVTSATTNRSKEKHLSDTLYTYTHIKTDLFVGYTKHGFALIAIPEKAFFDYLCLIAKGLKTVQYLDEMDYSKINKTRLKDYLDLVSASIRNRVYKLINKLV